MFKSLEVFLFYTCLSYSTSDRSFSTNPSKSCLSICQELDFIENYLRIINLYKDDYENDTDKVFTRDSVNTNEELFRSISDIEIDNFNNAENEENEEFIENENFYCPPLKYKKNIYTIHPILLEKFTLSKFLNRKYSIDLFYNSFLNVFKRIDQNNKSLVDFKENLKIKLKDIILFLYDRFNINYDSFVAKELQNLNYEQILQIINDRIKNLDYEDELTKHFVNCVKEMIKGEKILDMLRSYVSLYLISYYKCFINKEIFYFEDESNEFSKIFNNCSLFFENLLYCIDNDMKNCLSNYLFIIKKFEKILEKTSFSSIEQKVFYQIGILVFKLFNQLSEIDQENN